VTVFWGEAANQLPYILNNTFLVDGSYSSDSLFAVDMQTGNITTVSLSVGIFAPYPNLQIQSGASLPPTPPTSLQATSKALGDCTCNGSSGLPQVGNPITAATGNKFEGATDYTTAGPNSLAFTRYYNSMGSTSNPNTLAITLATNWRSTHDRYIQIASAASVSVERKDGQALSFTLNGGVWDERHRCRSQTDTSGRHMDANGQGRHG
jgi:hypothetical protein